LAREEGDLKRASRLLNQAAADATTVGSSWGSWASSIERARVAAAQNDRPTARAYALVAYEVAMSEGWRNRARRVAEEFNIDKSQSLSVDMSRSRLGGSSLTTSRTSKFDADRYSQALLQVSLATSSSLDIDEQAKRALTELARVLGAERALLFLVQEKGQELELKASYGVDEQGRTEFAGYSDTVVQKVRESRQPLVIAGTEEGEALGSQSAVVFGLRSIIAAPLLLREKLVGIVYLDNRLAKGVFTEDDVKVLVGIGNHIAIAVETAAMARIEAVNRSFQKDQDLAAAVQSLFLPHPAAYKSKDVSLAGFYRPAAQCGGDWWWHGVAGDGHVRVVVGDVMGHGVAPAMLTASIAGAFRVLCRKDPNVPLAGLLQQLNVELVMLTQGAFTMTVCALDYDPATRQALIWSAGGPPTIVASATGEVSFIRAPGTPLGTTSNFELGHASRTVAAGERLFLYTDGVTELKLSSGAQLGMRRLTGILSQTAGQPAERASAQVVHELDKARAGTEQDDDITYVVMDCIS
jgi:serine phosphatase RsbU (regulator of sigma subunit)